jgi:hypothetical protein
MTGEIPQPPQPEREHRAEVGLFNVAAMSDAQIAETIIALEKHEHGLSGERSVVNAGLVESVLADLRGHAAENPVRARELVAKFAQSDERMLQYAAANTADVLIDFDYQFTRDTLTWFAGFNFDHPQYEEIDIGDGAMMTAYGSIRRLMRDRLTPAQIDDFNASLAARGAQPTRPLAPGERA